MHFAYLIAHPPGVTTHLVASQAVAESVIPEATLEFCPLDIRHNEKETYAFTFETNSVIFETCISLEKALHSVLHCKATLYVFALVH